MPQDLFSIKKTVSKLKPILIGSKINKVTQPNQEEVIFTIFNGKVYNLILSANAKYCRCGLTTKEKPNPLTAPNFCMLLRKYLVGGEILDINALNSDRIIVLKIENKNDFKDDNTYEIYAEIMGKYSNVFLLKDGIILGSLKATPQSLDGKRIIINGAKYTLPESQNKTDVFDKNSVLKIFKNYNEENLQKYILNNFSYFSPVSAQELAYRIEKNYDANLPFNQVATSTLYDFINQELNPCIISANGVKDVFVTNYSHLEGERYYDNDLLTLQANFYDSEEESKNVLNFKNTLLSKINNKEKKELKLLELCEDKKREFIGAEKYKLYGELITSNLYLIKKGMEYVEVINYYAEDGKTEKIPLDINLSPSDNAQKYYKKYAKCKRACKISEEQRIEILKELNYVKSLKHEVDNSSNYLELKEIEEELIKIGLIKITAQYPSKKSKQVKKHTAYAVYNVDDFTIKRGKNNLQNDNLLEDAERLDIWLHTKNYHSSFVVIETKGNEVPNQVLLKSAEICAYNSEAKNSSKIEVDYTYKKYVKKQPNGKPGSVFYTDYKTIIVNPKSHEDLLKT